MERAFFDKNVCYIPQFLLRYLYLSVLPCLSILSISLNDILLYPTKIFKRQLNFHIFTLAEICTAGLKKDRNDMIIRKPLITLLRTKQTSAWYWWARKQTRRMYIVPIEWWPTTFYVYFLSDIKNMYNILQG